MPTFVIAVDSDQYSEDESTAVDYARVEADSYDSPITSVVPANATVDKSVSDLIASYVDDYPDYTPHMAVGLFGTRGMCREV